MKIVATISDCGAAVNCGGEVTKVSVVIEVPWSSLPPLLQHYLTGRDNARENKQGTYEDCSLSILEEAI
jgi:hypothetical protein